MNNSNFYPEDKYRIVGYENGEPVYALPEAVVIGHRNVQERDYKEILRSAVEVFSGLNGMKNNLPSLVFPKVPVEHNPFLNKQSLPTSPLISFPPRRSATNDLVSTLEQFSRSHRNNAVQSSPIRSSKYERSHRSFENSEFSMPRDATYVRPFVDNSRLMTFGETSYTYPVPKQKSTGLESLYNIQDSPLYKYIVKGPATYLAKDIFTKQLGIPGGTVTEKAFTREQLNVIDNQVRTVARRNGVTHHHFQQNPYDTIHASFNGPEMFPLMYKRQYGRNSDLDIKLFTPEGNVENTLGSYGIDFFRDGYRVKDIYDFNSGQGNYHGSITPFASGRRIAGKFGHTDKDADATKMHFNIHRNVNRWY